MAQYNRNIDLYIMDLNITTLSTTLDENAQSLGFKTIMVLTSAITEPNISSEPIPRTHFWIWLIFQIYGNVSKSERISKHPQDSISIYTKIWP
jgi:hypothetical protein